MDAVAVDGHGVAGHARPLDQQRRRRHRLGVVRAEHGLGAGRHRGDPQRSVPEGDAGAHRLRHRPDRPAVVEPGRAARAGARHVALPLERPVGGGGAIGGGGGQPVAAAGIGQLRLGGGRVVGLHIERVGQRHRPAEGRRQQPGGGDGVLARVGQRRERRGPAGGVGLGLGHRPAAVEDLRHDHVVGNGVAGPHPLGAGPGHHAAHGRLRPGRQRRQRGRATQQAGQPDQDPPPLRHVFQVSYHLLTRQGRPARQLGHGGLQFDR